jgi:hypothetical protein
MTTTNEILAAGGSVDQSAEVAATAIREAYASIQVDEFKAPADPSDSNALGDALSAYREASILALAGSYAKVEEAVSNTGLFLAWGRAASMALTELRHRSPTSSTGESTWDAQATKSYLSDLTTKVKFYSTVKTVRTTLWLRMALFVDHCSAIGIDLSKMPYGQLVNILVPNFGTWNERTIEGGIKTGFVEAVRTVVERQTGHDPLPLDELRAEVKRLVDDTLTTEQKAKAERKGKRENREKAKLSAKESVQAFLDNDGSVVDLMSAVTESIKEMKISLPMQFDPARMSIEDCGKFADILTASVQNNPLRFPVLATLHALLGSAIDDAKAAAFSASPVVVRAKVVEQAAISA